MDKEEIKNEMKDILEFNENEATTHPNLWDTMKVVLILKFIELSAFKMKLARAYINSLKTHMKTLDQNEANSPKSNRCKEIIKPG